MEAITPAEYAIGSTVEFLDSAFDGLVDNFRTASSDMEIGDIIFLNANEAEGTEAMVEATSELEDIVDATNRFKTFMSTDIADLMTECAENLRAADQEAGDSVNVEE